MPVEWTEFVRVDVEAGRNDLAVQGELQKHIDVDEEAIPRKEIREVDVNRLRLANLYIVVLPHIFQLGLVDLALVGVRVEVLDVALVGRIEAELAVVVLVDARQLHFHVQLLVLVPLLRAGEHLLIIKYLLRQLRVLVEVVVVAQLEVLLVAIDV